MQCFLNNYVVWSDGVIGLPLISDYIVIGTGMYLHDCALHTCYTNSTEIFKGGTPLYHVRTSMYLCPRVKI